MASDPMTNARRGGAPAFVVLDGVDGCGKTTQARRLVESLASDPLHLREPGSTVAGERIRDLVLAPDVALERGALAMLFAAARRQTLVELVEPALARGRDVVIERFHASTFAYQGIARDDDPPAAQAVDDASLVALLRTWAGAPEPTVEIVLDLAPSEAFARATARAGDSQLRDRFEARGLTFQERVAERMRRYVDLVPTAHLVDATGDADEVAARVLAIVGEASDVQLR